MLEKFISFVWKLDKFTYLYHLNVARKVYSQKALVKSLEELKNKENISQEMRELSLQYAPFVYKWMCDNQ